MTNDEKIYRLRRALQKAHRAIRTIAALAPNSQARAEEAARLAEHCRAVLAATGHDAAEPIGCPGYPGPCPEGMEYGQWLAMNNVD